MQSQLLVDGLHFHVVYTLPAEIAGIAYQKKARAKQPRGLAFFGMSAGLDLTNEALGVD